MQRFPATVKLGRIALLAMAISLSGPFGAHSARAADLVVNIDEASLHHLMREAATVIIGNPSIADVNVQGGTLLVVMGKNPGHTNIIALDRTGNEIENVVIHVRNSGSRRLTLQLGSNQLSYNCAPKCDRTLSVSDAEQPFAAQTAQIQNKTAVSQGTADQSGGAGQ